VYYAERIGDITVDSKKRWNAVKKLLHSNDRSSPLSKNEAKQRCDSISTYFVDKIRRLKDVTATRLAGFIRNPFSSDRPHSGALLNNLPCVTDEEVRKLIGTIPSKSSPMDFVPTSVLKQCSPVFIPLVTRLANLSFTEGIFPSLFKTAQITPLLKKEGLDSSDPSNYRPISNLNTISKIIERLALNRLRKHIIQSDNFSVNQSAYRQHYSTETALLHILNDIYGNIDEGQCTLLVALDMSAAFDTVEHSVLIKSVENSFGLDGSAIT
jgi:hypothetical protein